MELAIVDLAGVERIRLTYIDHEWERAVELYIGVHWDGRFSPQTISSGLRHFAERLRDPARPCH